MRNVKMGGVFLAFVVMASPAWPSGGFKGMAKELSKAAGKAGMTHVAVLPFAPADGSSSGDGWRISEKLTTQVVNSGQVQVVERALLKQLLDEHHLGQTGVLEQPLLKKLGKVFAVEGVITGSFVTAGADVVVQARLINIETGVIVAASEQQIARDWADSPKPAPDSGSASAYLWVPAPELAVAAPEMIAEMPAEGSSNLKDAVADDTCINGAAKVDGLNKEIMDIKARYWARQLKKGMSISGLRHNPGSEISDPAVKKAFYDRMRAWYVQENIPALTAEEVKRFVETDSKAFDLYEKCGSTAWFVAGK